MSALKSSLEHGESIISCGLAVFEDLQLPCSPSSAKA
jgi:hypothetical protein